MDKKEDVCHLFFVLSNITLLITESYIFEKKIGNAIILHPKRFIPQYTNCKFSYFPFYDDMLEYNLVGKNFIKKRRHRSEINNFIKEIIGAKNYVFYAPHFYINVLRVIIENLNCIDYNYIEEGTLSYYNSESVDKIMPTISLGFLERLGFGFNKREAFPDLSKKGIGINNAVFPSLSNKHIVSDDVVRSLLIKSNNSLDLSNHAILIFDSSVENKMIKLEKYLVAIINSIAFIKSKGYNKIYYKFHPDQFLYNYINYFREYLNSQAFGVEFEEIKPNVSLELVFMKSKNILLIHTISSLGFYSKLNNHETFSNAGCLLDDLEYKNKYFDKVNGIFNLDLIPQDA